MSSRFPQVSTHKLSLGLLARMVEANGKTKAWLLGVQPASLRPGQALSEPVRRTLEQLAQWLGENLERPKSL
jgi:Ni,Fe-hydrogenase maturation factor